MLLNSSTKHICPDYMGGLWLKNLWPSMAWNFLFRGFRPRLGRATAEAHVHTATSLSTANVVTDWVGAVGSRRQPKSRKQLSGFISGEHCVPRVGGRRRPSYRVFATGGMRAVPVHTSATRMCLVVVPCSAPVLAEWLP